MYQPNKPITKRKILLGEGVEEVAFFEALLAHLGIQDIQVDQFGGKSRMESGLKAMVKRTGFAENAVSLGVTRDSDFLDNPTADPAKATRAAFESVCHALRSAGLSVPPSVGVSSGGQPSVTVGILPGPGRLGMLEDVCLDWMRTLPEFACVEDYFQCVAQRAGRRQTRYANAKSRVHAWLAGMSPPDKRLGEAAAAGYYNWNDPAFSWLKQFVASL